MSVNSENIAVVLALLCFGKPDNEGQQRQRVSQFLDELASLNEQENYIVSRQNMTTWRRNQRIPLTKTGGVAVPLLLRFLGENRTKLENQDAELFNKVLRFCKQMESGVRVPRSAQLSSSIFFQRDSIKITSPISRRTVELTNLMHHLSGLYISYRYRFNHSTSEFPEIAREVMYIHPGPLNSPEENYPHFVSWYLRDHTYLCKYRGVAYPSGGTYWMNGFDETNGFRSRVLVLTKEDDLQTSRTNPVTSRVRGGIMVSDTQDISFGMPSPAACRFILEKADEDFVRELPIPTLVREELGAFAKKLTQFISPEELPDIRRQLILAAINNDISQDKIEKDNDGNDKKKQNLLRMPQELISALTD